jgi:serine O-acetyltransferase
MDRLIKADLFRYGGLIGIKGFIRGFFLIPGFRFMYLNRKVFNYRRFSILWFIFFFLLRRYSFKYGFQIPYVTEIGEGFYIGHHGTIIINGEAKIGKNCNVAAGVTIGQTNRGKLKGCPNIGDNVWIGIGSVIVGNITIGSNVLVAPNTYINFNVPSNSLVIGNPGKIIRKNNPTEGYITNILD